MDTLRGAFGDYSEADAYDPAEDEIGHETLPPAIGQDERRLQVRAYNHWASLLGDRAFPLIADLETGNLPDFDPYSVLLDFSAGVENPKVRYLGAELAEDSGCDVAKISSLSDVPNRSLVSRITDHYLQIIANQAPIGFEAEFVNQHGRTILYRGILLPFSGSIASDEIDLIYGVINWKELADQQTTDELMLEIDQVLQHKPALAPLPLTEWADGPAEIHTEIDQDTDTSIDEYGVGEDDFDGNDADILDLALLPEADVVHAWADDADEPGLADILASARELARAAQGSEDRSRQALYAAIGRAHDFALAAATQPEDFAELAADAGLTMQARAPLIPVVKLIFGADYDKTRLTEYATALAHAQRLDLTAGRLAAFLGSAPGGLKGVVQLERRLRREENGRDAEPKSSPREAIARKLRALPTRPLAALSAAGEEFTLVLARRTEDGDVVMIGELADDIALLERAARQLLR
ncbi:MAG: hypothetical protein FP826_12440 [Sphingomonadales bacterium]|nr:hypothetical protein [Sphingomonadales bacterium]MBU3993766.1 hypothetical protein [Alphaproteobacteria bacterium]